MAGQAQRIAAGQLLADFRADAVAADQRRRASNVEAVLGPDLHAVGGVLVADDALPVDERDVAVRAAGVEQHAVQIGAMDHRIGIAEAPAERLVDRDMRDLLAGHAVHHDQAIDIDRLGAAGVADAEIVHGVKSVGADLDAGADLAELVGLLQHRDVAALVGEAERGRQTADPAAGDDDCLSLSGHSVRSAWRAITPMPAPFRPAP